MTNYIFSGGNEKPAFSGPLPEGDYAFRVVDFSEPYQKPNGNWVLRLRLEIEAQTVWDQPWSGQQGDGTPRDGIGEFLVCVNRAPKAGEQPDWRKLLGARGKCRLKVEIAQMGKLAGKEVNRVAWYYRPKEIGPLSQPEAPRTYTAKEVEAIKKDTLKRARGGPENEPSDIPFKTRIYQEVRENKLNRRVF